MPFFTYVQNNSGGETDYDEDKGISRYVIVEASSAVAANHKGETIGLYFDGYGDCSCCGERWTSVEHYDEDAEPMIYDTPLHEFEPSRKWINGYEVFVHYESNMVMGLYK